MGSKNIRLNKYVNFRLFSSQGLRRWRVHMRGQERRGKRQVKKKCVVFLIYFSFKHSMGFTARQLDKCKSKWCKNVFQCSLLQSKVGNNICFEITINPKWYFLTFLRHSAALDVIELPYAPTHVHAERGVSAAGPRWSFKKKTFNGVWRHALPYAMD